MKEPIAIVGIGCRLPGNANSPESFWQVLSEGKNAVTEIPADRWDKNAFYHPSSKPIPGKTYSYWGGFISEVDKFEPECFGISPREAASMDPQQRLLLESTWNALEDAGIKPSSLKGHNTGVFIGIATSDYAELQGDVSDTSAVNSRTGTGSVLSLAANRISYCLDLRGPSLITDTACSSSLMSVHLACQSLWRGECESAIAGGVNAIFSPSKFVVFSQMGMLSPDGRCKTFDASANGFVRGEGVGIVILQPLSEALKNNRPIYALIKASATNQDGHTLGITVPSGQAQEQLLRKTYAAADIALHEVDYIEAHGTGTFVGDPIEANAIGRVMASGRATPCWIGSVKPNIGHLEGGSGIASLIKTALLLKHRKIPPNLHFNQPNPDINFEDLKLAVPKTLMDFPHKDKLAIAGVNSFGFGGANVHVALSGVPQELKSNCSLIHKTNLPYILPLSARNKKALCALVNNYKEYLDKDTTLSCSLSNICYSAALHREHFNCRTAFVAHSKSELCQQLQNWNESSIQDCVANNPEKAKIAFIFSGQGPQWWAMGRELLHQEPEFRKTIEQCDRYIQQLGNWSLLKELTANENESRINQTSISQPAIFAIQVALCSVWKSWGIVPGIVLGHSVGEVAAAYIAGVFSLYDACRIIFHRGRCMDLSSSKGQMLAVGLNDTEIKPWLENYSEDIAVAAINSTNSVTLSGDTQAVNQLAKTLKDSGIYCKFLAVDYAFHSPKMDPVQSDFEKKLAGLQPNAATIPMISTVTGEVIAGEHLTTSYWWNNIRQTVLFKRGIQEAFKNQAIIMLEIGPHPVLCSQIKEIKPEIHACASLRRNDPEMLTMKRALAFLFMLGVSVEFKRFWPKNTGQFIKIPGYPWQRQSYWNEAPHIKNLRLSSVKHPYLKVVNHAADSIFNFIVDIKCFTYLRDHQVNNQIIFPAAGYVEMLLAGSRQVFGEGGYILEEVNFIKPLVLTKTGKSPTLQLINEHQTNEFRIFSQEEFEDDWVAHAFCTSRLENNFAQESLTLNIDIFKSQCDERIGSNLIYPRFHQAGLNYAQRFQGIQALWRCQTKALAEIELNPEDAQEIDTYLFHPILFDCCLQAICGVAPAETLFLPIQMKQLRYYQKPTKRIWAHVVFQQEIGTTIICDINAYNEEGLLLISMKGVSCQQIGSDQHSRSKLELNKKLYRDVWKFQPIADDKSRVHGPSYYLPSATNTYFPALAHYSRKLKIENKLGKQYKNWSKDLDALAYALLKDKFGKINIPFFQNVPGHINSWIKRLSKSHRQYRSYNANDLLTEMYRRYPGGYVEILELTQAVNNLIASIKNTQQSSSLKKVEYQSASFSSCINEALVNLVEQEVKALPVGRVVRILGVGCSNDNQITYMLDALGNEKVNFTRACSDESEFNHATQHVARQEQVKLVKLNLNKDIESQELEPHSFEIIIISNLLFEIEDKDRALKIVQGLLAHHGLLILLEPSEHVIWKDLFYSFSHKDKSYQILKSQQWQQALLLASFSDVAVFEDFLFNNIMNQQIILARGSSKLSLRDKVSLSLPGRVVDSGKWLIFADAIGIALKLAHALREVNESVTVIAAEELIGGNQQERINQITYDYFASDELPSRGVIYMSAIQHQEQNVEITCNALQQVENSCDQLMHLVQALSRCNISSANLYLVTRGAQSVNVLDQVDILQAPLCGLMRVIHNEHQELLCKYIDLDPKDYGHDIHGLWNELWLSQPEQEVAYRDTSRWVLQFQRAKLSNLYSNILINSFSDKVPFYLKIGSQHSFNSLTLQESEAMQLAPDQIKIKVYAAGLNFRDVLKALGLYPQDNEDCIWLGDECAGVVVATGKLVTHIKVGDEVMALARGCLGSYAYTNSDCVLLKPKHMSFEEAATLPIVFLTAYYCLCYVADLKKNDKILIQAAAGGVGLAAIQIAKHIGAEIFATASQSKQSFLQSLGINHVMDSRSMLFADEVMHITGGAGVDVVLNSLSGQAIPLGISTLKPFGKFIEIGKRDIYEHKKLGLYQLRENLSFHVIDLSRLIIEKTTLVKTMMRELSIMFKKGVFHPLPYQAYPITEAKKAFRDMSQGKHIGKIIISTLQQHVYLQPKPRAPFICSDDKSYLITGGLGGIGFSLANWLTQCGAKHLILLSRKGFPNDKQRQKINLLQERGVHIVIEQVDVTNSEKMAQLFATIKNKLPPLGGIFHLAMVIDSDLLANLDRDRFASVMRPKVIGAWNLHKLSLGMDLDHFVLFSSMTSKLGSHGLANYATANAFLDGFAHYRKSCQLPCVNINWGQMLDVGYLSQSSKLQKYLTSMGDKGINDENLFAALSYLLTVKNLDIGVLNMNWLAFKEKTDGHRLLHQISQFLKEEISSSSVLQKSDKFKKMLLQADSASQKQMIHDYVALQISQVLGLTKDKVEINKPINDMGLDSLMLVEFMNKLKADLGLNISLHDAQKLIAQSVDQLSEMILIKVIGDKTESQVAPSANATNEENIVILKTGLTSSALYCIPGLDGNVNIYTSFTESLPQELNVYGLTVSASDGLRYSSIRQLSAYYANLIVKLQPKGPYVLFGFSLGGVIALETAKQLELQKKQVSLIGLIDPIFPAQQSSSTSLLSKYIELYILTNKNLFQKINPDFYTKRVMLSTQLTHASSMQQQKHIFLDALFRGKPKNNDLAAEAESMFLQFQHGLYALQNYQMSSVEASTIVWRPSESFADYTLQNAMLSKACSSGVEIKTLKGNHFSIINNPEVKQIASYFWEQFSFDKIGEVVC